MLAISEPSADNKPTRRLQHAQQIPYLRRVTEDDPHARKLESAADSAALIEVRLSFTVATSGQR